MKTADLIDRAIRKLPKMKLDEGGHAYAYDYTVGPEYRSGDRGTCLMEAVAYIAREEHSDHPRCTADVLSGFGITINDACPSDSFRNKILKPVIPVLLNTSSKKAREGGSATDDHNRKVREYLLKLCKERLPLSRKPLYISQKPAVYLDCVIGECDSVETPRKIYKILRIAADILKDAACYAREQLGPDVDAPVKPVYLNDILVKEAKKDTQTIDA